MRCASSPRCACVHGTACASDSGAIPLSDTRGKNWTWNKARTSAATGARATLVKQTLPNATSRSQRRLCGSTPARYRARSAIHSCENPCAAAIPFPFALSRIEVGVSTTPQRASTVHGFPISSNNKSRSMPTSLQTVPRRSRTNASSNDSREPIVLNVQVRLTRMNSARSRCALEQSTDRQSLAQAPRECNP